MHKLVALLLRAAAPRVSWADVIHTCLPRRGWAIAQTGFPNLCLWLIAGWLWLGLVPTFSADSSARYSVDTWTVDDGLPDSAVFSITQTQDGYLWLGTLNGLVRFDGVHFVTFDESNTPRLQSRRILTLFEDSRSTLWIGTENAGAEFVTRIGLVSKLQTGKGAQGGPIRSFCEDANGAVWVYTDRGLLARSAQDASTLFWTVGSENPSSCRCVIRDQSGRMWVGTDQGLAYFQSGEVVADKLPLQVASTGKIDFLLSSQEGYWVFARGRIQKWNGDRLVKELAKYAWSAAAPITAACEDAEGSLIVGTYGEGAYRIDSTGAAERLPVPHNTIRSVKADRQGSLWVGSEGGLSRLRKLVFTPLKESLGFVVQSVCEDTDGSLWIGYNGYGRVDHWDNGAAKQLTVGPPDTDLWVRALGFDRDHNLWVGTDRGGLFQFKDNAFHPAAGLQMLAQISAIYLDHRGIMWVGGTEALAWNYGSRWALLPVRGVKAITDDEEGNIWVGTENEGLLKVTEAGPTVFVATNGLPSGSISALCRDEAGTLWIGTSKGLARLHHGKWTSFAALGEAFAGPIGYLITDSPGDLWIGSSAGLARVPRSALNRYGDGGDTNSIPVRVYEKSDGLPTRQCTQGSQPAACQARDGRLWFATIKGLAGVDPSSLRLNTNVPPVLIESVRIDKDPVLVNGLPLTSTSLRPAQPPSITVPARKETVEITYTCLNLAAPEKSRFRYRLKDHDTWWIETTWNNRTVHYSRLPQGHFEFQVQACNEDEVWGEPGCAMTLVVLPPFWRTWWFLTGVGLCLLGGVAGSVYYVSTQRLQRQLAMHRQQEAVEKERARIARDIHDQLGANLTQVSLLGEMVESDKHLPDEVEAHGKQISQTALETTRALDEIVWTVNPSNDTLDSLITYICKYAQDYFEVAGLRYRLDVPAELPNTPISPEIRHNVFLAAKEAITNVVRHAKATAALLRLKLEPGRFTLEIEDNGRGVSHLDLNAPQTRNGLRNMSKRMEDVGGTFSIGPGAEAGAVVRLSAPLREPTN